MKIIHFVANLSNLRGMENQAFLQYGYQKEKFEDVKLWTFSLPKIFEKEKFEGCHLIVKKIFIPKIIFGSIIIFFKTLFIDKKTIIHVHGLSEYIVPFLCARIINKRIKIILKISNSGKKSTFIKLRKKFPIFGNYLILFCVKHIDKWIYINSQIKDEILKEGVDFSRIYNVPNGIELFPKKEFLSKKFSNSLAWVGSLSEHKNLEFALQIMKNLPHKYSLTIYGSGPLHEKINRYIIENSLSKKVFLKGWISKEKLHKDLAKHSIYISTSKAEGLSNALLEAISLGLFPLCYRISGNEEVLGKEYKFILDNFDVNHWVNNILLISKENYNLKNYLNNRLNNFNIDYIMDLLDKTYKN